jgi:hypothetical protein
MLRTKRECSALLMGALVFSITCAWETRAGEGNGSRMATCAEPISSSGGELDLLGAFGSSNKNTPDLGGQARGWILVAEAADQFQLRLAKPS